MPKFLSSPKGRNFFLEFGNSRQNNPPDELNDTDIFCLSLMVLEPVLETLTICSCGIALSSWAKSPIHVGKFHSTPPTKIQIDSSQSLPRINQYPVSKGLLQGVEPIIKDYKFKGLIVSCTGPCNTIILPV